MKNRLLALGATLAVFAGGCESEQKDVCSSATNISENVQCDVEDVITDTDIDNDERHPRDDRPPRTPGGNDDVFDEEDTTEDINTIEDDIIDNEIIDEETNENDSDIIEEDTIIDYPLDPSMEEDCFIYQSNMRDLIYEYETNFSFGRFDEIIIGHEFMREILNKYNVDIFFQERVERGRPNHNWDNIISSGYSSTENGELFMMGSQIKHRTTNEMGRWPRSIMTTINNDLQLIIMEFVDYAPTDDNYAIYTYNFRYSPHTNEMSGCSFKEQQPNITNFNTVVDNLCLDLCERIIDRIPSYMTNFFESEYSQPAE